MDDLASIQQTRDLIANAKAAQSLFAGTNQKDVDRIVEAMAKAGLKNSRKLAEMAVKETGIGVVEDKIKKNEFASRNVYEYIKDMKTAGIIREDKENGVIEVGDPMGVLAGIIPTTNPTSTIIFKSIISVKSRNAIVFSPHPRAVECSYETTRIMAEAAESAGAPKGLINCIRLCTKEGTNELMSHRDVDVILATGGSAMVKAAYSSGKPAFGVGPGNVPAFIEKSAEIPKAVCDIITSKSFDNGTICASEQAVITDESIAKEVVREFIKQGGHFVLDPNDLKLLEKTVIQPGGGVNPSVVGKSAEMIAKMAGIKVPEGTRVLIAPLEKTGKDAPLSHEKLCPVLAFYIESSWQAACERSFELLELGGLGHSLVIHSKDDRIIREFALKKPVNRILVNTPSSFGAIGLSTGLQPSLTLGCGTKGGNITSDNVGPQHLINRKRLAYSREEDSDCTKSAAVYIYSRAEVIKAISDCINA